MRDFELRRVSPSKPDTTRPIAQFQNCRSTAGHPRNATLDLPPKLPKNLIPKDALSKTT